MAGASHAWKRALLERAWLEMKHGPQASGETVGHEQVGRQHGFS